MTWRPALPKPIIDALVRVARGGFDGAVGQLGLQLLKPALDLLAELKKLLEICHAFG